MNILVLHGPNLNLMGERPGDEEGRTLEQLNEAIERRARQLGAEVRILQSNHEGALIDALHAARQWAQAVVINPGALTHTSYVLREALVAVNKPAIEVHLSDLRRRESWRRKSVIKDVCQAQILGKGFDSYLLAIDALAGAPKWKRSAAEERPARTLGRKQPNIHAERSGAASKRPRAKSQPAASISPLRGAAQPERGSGANGKHTRTAAGSAQSNRGSGAPEQQAGPASAFLTRALVRQKIAERLGGKLTPSGLSTWARSKWLDVQRGAPAESGQREVLEDSLQQLVLASMPPAKLSDEELVDLMAQLDG